MQASRFVQFRHVQGRGVASGRFLLQFVLMVLAGALLAPSAAAQVFTTVYSFSARAGNPTAGLTLAPDGKLYGPLAWGGLYGLGSVYVLTPDSQGDYTYSELFSAAPADGVKYLDTPLLAASDGRFYGAATQLPNSGGIYRVDAIGNFELMHSFDAATEGSRPSALIEIDGAFYGVTNGQGGGANIGTLFRMDADGVVTVLHHFHTTEGGYSWGSLLAASDGFLYGTTTNYGENFLGTVFKSDLSGNVTVVHSFAEGEGSFPGTLVEGDGGMLYGTAESGGAFGNGTVFRVDAAGTLTTLHSFAGGDDGAIPGDLFRASDGYFYGTTFYGGPLDRGTIFRIDAAGTVETLRTLSAADGTWPSRRLLEAGGMLIGTALRDGAGGVGTAFAFDAAGDFKILQAFRAAPEGTAPIGGLVHGSDGNLYGSAMIGGDRGFGTIYRLDPAGSLEVLHALDRDTDGAYPSSDLLHGSDGALYGTASQGGAGQAGTVFRCETAGGFTTLHAFTGLDGRQPLDGLAEGSDGNYYGAVYAGGPSDFGTLYRVDSLGNFDLLHQFDGTDGGTPLGALVAASDGNLYGTTVGASSNGGTLFRLDVAGGFEVVHDFVAAAGPEGLGPVGTLLEGSDGYLYGATRSGTVFRSDFAGAMSVVGGFSFADGYATGGLVDDGNGNLYGVLTDNPGWSQGVVYRIDAHGGYAVIHRFTGFDGSSPRARLLRASDGKLYGTTSFGGELLGGVVFKIDPAAVISLAGSEPPNGPASGGTTVTIHGSAFLPGASVQFGGVPASNVTVVSSSEITVVAPALFPGTSYDIVVVNGDLFQVALPRAWVADPLDVLPSSPYYDAIVRLLANLVSAGCGDGNYCPNAFVTRAQLAVLLLRAKLGPFYAPPPATGTAFLDVTWDSFGADWIEDLAARGITVGCGAGNFCPSAPVIRAALAPLLLKTLLGPSYKPPNAIGATFGDVPSDSFAAGWIEDLAGRGISAGCSTEPALYCPSAATTRGQLAANLVHAFDLPLEVVSRGPVR